MEETEEKEIEAPPEIAPEVVEKAQRMGWMPPDQFKGDKERFTPADQYVKRAEEMMPIMKNQLNKYDEKVQRYESEITGLKSSLDAQKKTTEKLVKMSATIGEKAYNQAKRDITKEQAAAVADGDVEKWQNLEDKKESLEKPEPIEIEQAPQPQNPVFDQWQSGNDWYSKDPDMTIWADGYAQSLQSKNPNMSYGDVLKSVGEQAKTVFSNKFENPNRQQAPAVDESSGPADMKPGKKAYRDLPGDAKAACDIVVEQNLMTKEEYIKEYFEE